MDDFLDSVGPILFSAIIILFLVCAPDYFDTIKENKIAIEEEWTLVSENTDEYTVYIDGNKVPENFDAFGIRQDDYFIRVDTKNKKIYLNKKTFLDKLFLRSTSS